MTDPLDNPIERGGVYHEPGSGTWTVVEEVYVSEDGQTQVRIRDRLFPEPGRARVDCWNTPETERRTVTKRDVIERVSNGELRHLDKDGTSLSVGDGE